MTDNSVQVDPNAVILVRSSNQSGQELPIGNNAIKVTATDEAGNMNSCSFNIVVRGNYCIYMNHCSQYLSQRLAGVAPVSDGDTKSFNCEFLKRTAQRDKLCQESLRCSFISCPYPTSEQNLLFSHLYFVSDLRERSIDNPFQTSKISTRLDIV